MPTRRQLLTDLSHRIGRARDRGEWHAAELYTATALRIASEPDLPVSGQRRRAARKRAAEVAKLPLRERMSMGKEKISPDPHSSPTTGRD
jgi:hypothetical protein